jgi:hypothetical protein
MPFTLAHPIIVIPLKKLNRNWFSLTALVIGSMVPDFEYFIRMKVYSVYSHTIQGIFWFCLPIGLLSCFIFHDIIRNDFIDNCPILRFRFHRYNDFNWNAYFKKKWYIVIVSLLIGIVSHILWDNFSHNTGIFVKLFPSLKSEVVFFKYALPIYKIIQYVSSIMGMVIIAIIVLRFKSGDLPERKIRKTYWLGITIIMISIMAVNIILREITYKNIGQLVVILISAFGIAITIMGIIFKVLRRFHYDGQKDYRYEQ